MFHIHWLYVYARLNSLGSTIHHDLLHNEDVHEKPCRQIRLLYIRG